MQVLSAILKLLVALSAALGAAIATLFVVASSGAFSDSGMEGLAYMNLIWFGAMAVFVLVFIVFIVFLRIPFMTMARREKKDEDASTSAKPATTNGAPK